MMAHDGILWWYLVILRNIYLNDLVANIAQVAKKLMVMGFAVCQTFPFIMAISQERFFTFGTDKMFHMPMFPLKEKKYLASKFYLHQMGFELKQ